MARNVPVKNAHLKTIEDCDRLLRCLRIYQKHAEDGKEFMSYAKAELQVLGLRAKLELEGELATVRTIERNPHWITLRDALVEFAAKHSLEGEMLKLLTDWSTKAAREPSQ